MLFNAFMSLVISVSKLPYTKSTGYYTQKILGAGPGNFAS